MDHIFDGLKSKKKFRRKSECATRNWAELVIFMAGGGEGAYKKTLSKWAREQKAKRPVKEGAAVNIYFLDPEEGSGELYWKILNIEAVGTQF